LGKEGGGEPKNLEYVVNCAAADFVFGLKVMNRKRQLQVAQAWVEMQQNWWAYEQVNKTQDACDRLLGVDGVEEFTTYLASVGKR
jgi:hypothetical protein